MPCRERFPVALQETVTTEDGVEMYTWRAVRRQHLRMLRKQVRTIVFFMALMEALRVGAADIVYQGRHGTKAPGPEDYGIAYNVGYFMSWLYMCLFSLIYVPVFSWWLPSLLSSGSSTDDPSTGPDTGDRVLSILNKINAVLLPICIGMAIGQHIYYTISAFLYVDAKPVDTANKGPKLNTRRNWGVRALLFSAVMTSMAVGKVAFMIFETMDLARVKPIEYLLIVVPVQINLGILFGSLIQFKSEQRAARKLAAIRDHDAEQATVDEKQNLLVQD